MDGAVATVRVEVIAGVLALTGAVVGAVVWGRFRRGIDHKGNRIIELLSSILDELRKK